MLSQTSQFTSTRTTNNILEQIQKTKSMRPRSPFYIYQLQLTSGLSILSRITGVAIGIGFYGVTIAYPAFGLTSEVSVQHLEAIPSSVKTAAKFIIAFPFMFHNFNGIRHLVWDTASSLTVKGVYTSGYLVIGASVLSSIGLASV
ncbi:cytochrome b560 subunit of succinate dehydrogenase [Neoconidiobolus thromboides FSU 785]|nr:cytochrome b560 subunit of succinate dehydrogenase [Neoconidiobolus thromboides FSU 785]